MTEKHKQWLLKQMPQQLVKLIHHPCTHEDFSSCNLELNGCLILSPVLCNQSWNSLDCMLLTGPQYSSESAQEILLCIRVVKAGREKPWGETGVCLSEKVPEPQPASLWIPPHATWSFPFPASLETKIRAERPATTHRRDKWLIPS